MPVIELPSAGAAAALGMAGKPAAVCYDRTDAEYRADFGRYVTGLGYRIRDIHGYQTGAGTRFAAIFEYADAGPQQWSRHEIPLADLDAVTKERKLAGMRPLRLGAYVVGNDTFFTAVWEAAPSPSWSTHYGVLTLGLDAHVAKARRQGFRIVDLCGYSPPAAPDEGARASFFTSIWERSGEPEFDGREWQVIGPLDAAVHQRVLDRLTAEGWRPVRVSGWDTGDEQVFITLWERSGRSVSTRHGIDAATLAASLTARDREGLRPEELAGYSVGVAASSRFCPIWSRRDAEQVVPPLVAEFANDHGGVSAVAIAVAHNGKLAYSHGYGITDPVSGHPVVPDRTRFRIASVSKPITAAAVMQLAQRGLLTLDDTVFGSGGHLADFGAPVDPRATSITVRHLLQHAGGGWSNDGNDPMYTHRDLDADGLVKTIITERALDHAPGTTYAYSNFGYCVLARVIEKITGLTYERHVQRTLLADCGITDMLIAGDRRADRVAGEVLYYDSLDGNTPYDIPVHRMDANGGWLATAVDLLRFAVRVDGFVTPPDILDSRWIGEMTTVPDLAGSTGYAAGWGTTPEGTWSHNGLLAGSTSWLVRTADGYCWSALVNTASRDTIDGLNRLMWTIRDRVDFWPTPADL